MTEPTQPFNSASTGLKHPERTPRPKRILPSLQASARTSDLNDTTYICKVESSVTQWEQLPLYALFSLTADGSYPKIKVSRSKYCDIRSMASDWAGTGSCYRVIL
jgi:hypothetical protein